MCFEQFYGLLSPGKNSAFEHTSILVRPHQEPRFPEDFGGAAGYCPRVRCVYYTRPFIAISRRNGQCLYSDARLNGKCIESLLDAGSTSVPTLRRRGWQSQPRTDATKPLLLQRVADLGQQFDLARAGGRFFFAPSLSRRQVKR